MPGMTPAEILADFNQRKNLPVTNGASPCSGQTQSDTKTDPLANVSTDELLAILHARGVNVAAAKEPNREATGASYFDRYVEKECKTEEERENLTSDVNSFWQRLKEYQTDATGNRAYGLAVGRVQSGKTRNYIGLMFKAIDEGYNTIIILTSKNNLLARQTHKRVEDWLMPETATGVGLGVRYRMLTGVVLNANQEETGVEWRGGVFDRSSVNVGIVIKNERGHLEKVREWVDGLNRERRTSEMRMLFIDDESDSATPNTNNAGAASIEDGSDVERLKKLVRDCGVCGADFIAEWIKSLCETEFDENGNCATKLRRATTKKGLMDLVQRDKEFQQGVGLTGDVQLSNGQSEKLSELVHDAFNRRATKRQPLNWATLRDLFNYVFGIRQERSRINKSICELVGESDDNPACFSYGKMVYVGYTATPYANLLQEGATINPLCPDSIKPLASSSNYFGLQRIFGDEPNGCNMNIVRTIGPDEITGWLEPLQNGDLASVADESAVNLTHNWNFADENAPEDVRKIEWKSLKRAVMWAFCTAAARRIDRLKGEHNGDYADVRYRWTTMLFNVSHLSNQENGVHPVQQQLLETFLAHQIQPENREAFIGECCRVWEEETRAFTLQNFNDACPGYGARVEDYPDTDRIETEIRDWFIARRGKFQVVQVNSNVDDDGQANYFNENVEGDVLWFVCGGNAISRGLTLDGLTVSYYDRIKRSTAVDSITQMGRWFGYRQGYELLPRIWMSEDTISEMKNICRVEESLHVELQDLFDDQDHTSIRKGRNVAEIKYFGRRLSGRDANGEEIGGLGASGVFEIVSQDAAPSFGRTRRFIQDLPNDARWHRPDTGYTRALHTRHEFVWNGVAGEGIVAYLRDMGMVCFKGASNIMAQGLMREVENHIFQPWNVVIGNPNNPDTHFTVVKDVATCKRHNPINDEPGIDGAKRIGKRQLTMNALYTMLPDNVIDEAERQVKGRYAGDFTEKFETLDIAYGVLKNAGADARLLYPMLLIDFIDNGSSTPYVQLSFYWQGLSTGSYFRAIVDPTRPTLMPRAIEIIKQQGYISRLTLFKLLDIVPGSVEEQNVREELCALCAENNAPIRVVEDRDADESILEHNIVYSVEWLDKEKGVDVEKTAGQVIGEHLYKMIVNRGWNCWKGRWLDYKALTNSGYDYVMAYFWNMKQYKWNEFRNRYQYCDLKFESPQEITPSPKHKKSARGKGRGWAGLIQCVLEPDGK